MESTRNIIVAVDHSDASAAAFKFAVRMFGNRPEYTLNLVHCYTPLETIVADEFTYVPSAADKAKNEEKHMAELKQFVAEHAAGINCKSHLVSGDPRYVLCDLAQTWHAEMVIVGNSGKGFVKRALLGSVSGYLAHHCEAPLTIIRA